MSMIQESEESGGASAAFEVRWENYGGSMARVLTELRQEEAFVDVTLASCDGGRFHAHRVVLSACSSYLRQVLHDLPLWQHPVLLLRDVPASDLEALLTFVYLGWVSVDRHQLPSFLRSARFLRIRGLAKMVSPLALLGLFWHIDIGTQFNQFSDLQESSAENGIMMVDKENPCEGGTLDDTTDPTGNSNPCSPGTSTTDDLPNNRGKKRQHNTPKKGQGGSALEISSTLLVPQKADNKNKRVSPGGEALSYKNRKRSSTSTGLSSVTATISLIPRRAPQRNDEVPSEGKDATSPPQSSSAPMGPLCSLMVAATKVKQEAPDLDDIEDATEDGPDDLEPPQARRRRRSLVSSQSEQVVVPADPSLMMPGTK